jgi:hypothetical protein
MATSAQFETGPLSGDASTAFAIAANIAWSQGAEHDPQFGKIGRETFVAWALVWWDFRAFRDRVSTVEALSDEDKKRWKLARALADKLIKRASDYPEIWRLRAELIDAAPKDLQTADDQNQAKADWKRYAEATSSANVASAAATSKITGTSADRPPVTPTGDVTVRPGRIVWADSRVGSSAVTITAIVTDKNGDKKIILPEFIIPPELGEGAEMELRLDPAGPVVARARKADIVRPQQSGAVFSGIVAEQGGTLPSGVVLAKLEPSAKFENTAQTDSAKYPITTIAAVSVVGEPLTLLSTRGAKTGKLTQLLPMFAVTDRISNAGDAGAPVLNASGQLVAMGYFGNEKGSQFLLLKWLFDKSDLKLAS